MGKKERNLTPAEQKRKADFEVLCKTMEESGYQRKDLTIGIVQANVVAILVMLPFAVAAILGFFFAMPKGSTVMLDITSLATWLLLFVAILLLCVAHEAIHGLCWGLCAKHHFRSIHFSIIWSALAPYCTCSEALSKGQYMVGSAMPTVILGFLPAGLAIWLHEPWLLILSVVMMFGGGADFTILLKMLRFRPKEKEVLFYDHPYECGIVAFVK